MPDSLVDSLVDGPLALQWNLSDLVQLNTVLDLKFLESLAHHRNKLGTRPRRLAMVDNDQDTLTE